MLEGIVSLSHPVPPLRGLAAFVSAQELSLFLAQVEVGASEVLRLDGGEALKRIAEAEDPAVGISVLSCEHAVTWYYLVHL
jgi:hypothetical protein